MRLSQLQDRIEKDTGYRPPAGAVNAAVAAGVVRCRKVGGWRVFNESAVEQLKRYLETRSRDYAFRDSGSEVEAGA
ncbi:hypothetical protein U8335_11390 [Roseiconus lacunae]|uniref:hypothetical protein n=1 Tax=Roseiconus lacunae TaxID=2605694 RepID=UPI00308FDDEB|nr:hypothetical protein U8335_11390 [Stieleria sp. HD01]